MKKLLILLVLPFLMAATWNGAAITKFNGVTVSKICNGNVTLCTTPTGTTLTESFGEGSQLCWVGGPSTCNYTWSVGTGTAQTIEAMTGTPPANTACANAIKINTASPGNVVYLAGFPRIPSGTAFDVYFTFTLDSTVGMATYSNVALVRMGTDADGGSNTVFSTGFYKVGSTTKLGGSGGVAITEGKAYQVHIHVEPGTGASYTDVGGTSYTWTASAKDALYLILGTTSSSYVAHIGNIRIDSALGAASPISLYADFENGSDGDMLTTTNLAAGTHGGNGVWTTSSSPTRMTIETDAELSLHRSIAIGELTYNDSGSTRGISLDYLGTADQWVQYTFYATSPAASMGFFVKSPATDSAYYPLVFLAGGSDYACLMFNNNQMYLEVIGNPNGDPDTGSKYTYSAGSWYYVTIKWLGTSGASMSLAIYETSTWTQVANMTKTATGTGVPNYIKINMGDNGASGVFFIDDLKVDYVHGTFPLLP